ncbi:basic helix-loop-helix (bHLH) DNA-bindingsuperfamily protein [Striga asiatica]|uniref:Basic helix-loop-helix (BHLH) DNA-bindingsuperfamily protein n=1 Tax=Striga asiatica TaxID=4170 RepID=A0A5A7PYI7_STRAF|nr:basic helix-loop-helix (bHLH) DNA-bindingsuperfamily protein [Striga asiatica]
MNRRHDGGATIKTGGGSLKRAILRIWIFRQPNGSSRFSLGNFFRNVGAKVSKALPAISAGKKYSGQVSSSASLAKSQSYAEAFDCQRAEAIEVCIEFLNKQRSSLINSSC